MILFLAVARVRLIEKYFCAKGVAAMGKTTGLIVRKAVSSASSRRARKYCFIFRAHAGNVIEYGANDVHPVVQVDEIHRRHNEQGYTQVRPMACGASQTRHSRPNEKIRERPFIARGPKLF